ncbi:MAG: hypothetical protein ACKVP7_12750 [Hyphomicrobiaceae bacterium]
MAGPTWQCFGFGMAAVLATGGLIVTVALAEPLAKEDCEKFKVEQAALEKAGIKDVLQKGATWGRANLGADKLKQVERFIFLEEQLSFRCGQAKARLTLPFAEEDQPPAAPEDAAKAETGDPAVTPPVAKAKPKPKPKPAVEAAAPDAAKEQPAKAAAPAPAKPAPKPKPKVDDALKVPPAQGDPFANQKPAAAKKSE